MSANELSRPTGEITVAIAGQPNTGKSTVFNFLTGSNQHVGNWPGITVEKKEGRFVRDGISYRVVDLPGTYSLSANSKEEMIARDFVIKQAPDLIVVVVDASQLTRSLYLVAEMMSLGAPMILALNMMDVAEKKGLAIDLGVFEKSIGVPVVPMTASKRIGIDALSESIAKRAGIRTPVLETCCNPDGEYADLLQCLQDTVKGYVPEDYRVEWVAQKLLEEDGGMIDLMQKQMDEQEWRSLRKMLPDDNRGAFAVARARYDWIHSILANSMVREKNEVHRSLFDKVATNLLSGTILGMVVTLTGFVLAIIIAFGCVVMIHPLAANGIQMVQNTAGQSLPLLADFIAQGVIPALSMIFGVSVFIFGIMLFTSFLEDIGYLPRMAYIADMFMSRIGLPGKSFMPLFMGFGCNIASVMGCRVIESTRQRFKTIIISSHVPCPGVMVTIAFMIGIFFGPVAPVIVVAATVALLVQTYITSRLLDSTVLRGAETGMIMELPPYHMPNWQTIWAHVWRRFTSFVRKAGSLIAFIIAVIWALSYFPNGNMVDSYLAVVGKAFEPLGMLMGMDWRLLTCLFVAFFSKEAALIAIAVLYGIQIEEGALTGLMMDNIFPEVGNDAVGRFLAGNVSQPSALAFIFALLFSIPCYATVGAVYYETKSLKWTIGSAIYYTTLSLVWGIAAYHAGLLLFTP